MSHVPTAGPLELDGTGLSPRAVAAAARRGGDGARVTLGAQAVERMGASVALKESLLAQEVPIYAVTTGFGDSCVRQISPDKAHELQRNLVLYHLNGVGPAAVPAVARAAMIIRANALAKGVSAIRPQTVSALLECLERDILPLIPERGSVGASGDLVPLCYLAAALIGVVLGFALILAAATSSKAATAPVVDQRPHAVHAHALAAPHAPAATARR